MREPPVDSEIIRQRIYDAGKSLGRNDPFLASELTDSVMHFLEQDYDSRAISPHELLATVTKVISELGHPQLAMAVESDWTGVSDSATDGATPDAPISHHDLDQIAQQHLSEYSLAHVYPSSIVSAQELGLIELQDLELPRELVGGVLELNRRTGLSEHGLISAIAHARHRFGRFVEVKLPDEALQTSGPNEWCATLTASLDLARLHAKIHLPRLAPGPREGASLFTEVDPARPVPMPTEVQLFPDEMPASSPNTARLAWIRAIVQTATQRIQPIIPVVASDLEDVTFIELMHVLVVNEVPAIFTFARGDSASWQVTGGRDHCPAVLTSVRANLPALLSHFGKTEDTATIFDRLGGLVRLAYAAGRAKQTFLRRHGHPSQREGFLLDRSAIVVTPLGITELARSIARDQRGRSELENRIVQQLHAASRQCSAHGPPCLLRHEAARFTEPAAAVPSHCNEVCIPNSSSALASGQELLRTLLWLQRETSVSAVWINGEDCS